jgi:hypothetical protein
MRNWIRFGAVGLALATLAWINLDASPRPLLGTLGSVDRPDALERFLESLSTLPVALVGGALWGAILGASMAAADDVRRWLRKHLWRDHEKGEEFVLVLTVALFHGWLL